MRRVVHDHLYRMIGAAFSREPIPATLGFRRLLAPCLRSRPTCGETTRFQPGPSASFLLAEAAELDVAISRRITFKPRLLN